MFLIYMNLKKFLVVFLMFVNIVEISNTWKIAVVLAAILIKSILFEIYKKSGSSKLIIYNCTFDGDLYYISKIYVIS